MWGVAASEAERLKKGMDNMKVTGSIRAIKVLATALVLSVFALTATACTSCTKNGEADTTGTMDTTVPTTETTTPITGPDGTIDSTVDDTTGGTAADTRVEETTSQPEETSGFLRRLF